MPQLRVVLGLAVLSTFSTAVPLEAAAQPTEHSFPIVFHVATEDDEQPVVSREALDGWAAEATQRFAPAGIGFVAHEVRHLPAGHARLEDIRSRRRLARYLRGHHARGTRRAINVFVVDRMRDPTPSATTRRAAAMQSRGTTGWISGAHIRMRGLVPDTFIVMTRRGGPLTLSHELGHFFGAPHHPDPTNIMSYGRERATFDERQIRVFRWMARRRLRRGELRPAEPPDAGFEAADAVDEARCGPPPRSDSRCSSP